MEVCENRIANESVRAVGCWLLETEPYIIYVYAYTVYRLHLIY